MALSTDATTADKTFTGWEVERMDCCAAPGGALRCLTGFCCPACLYGQVVKDMLENSDKSHYPELYQDGCCGCLFCDMCPATTAFMCGSSGPCCGSCGFNQAWKISTLLNIMRPKNLKTDYATCPYLCCFNQVNNYLCPHSGISLLGIFSCGACALVQMANVADRRRAEGRPVVTQVVNPQLEAQLQMMQQMQAQSTMMAMQAQMTAMSAVTAASAGNHGGNTPQINVTVNPMMAPGAQAATK